MLRKCGLVLVLSGFLITLFGCETFKGAANGAASGAKKDLTAIKKADDWMRKNLW